MRLSDALTAVKSGKPKQTQPRLLSTVWGENTDPEHVLQEYPRPQLRRRDWICLNGLWQYAFSKKKNRPPQPEGEILVPFSPESRLSGVNRSLKPGEYLWYTRTVVLREIPEGKRLLLHFGAVDQSCVVWWNGHTAGKSESGYLPFSMDVTEYLKEGKNTIRVRVRDDTEESCHARGKQSGRPGGMFYTAQSGIWQTVWMEWVPENHITGLKLTPYFDERAVRIEVTSVEPVDMEIRMNWEEDTYVHRVRARDFPAGSRRYLCELPVPGFRTWSPEDPFLYHLEVDAGEDRVSSYFAMRRFSVGMDENRRPRLFLNNRPYFFHGVLDQGYWPESLYTPPSDRAMEADIRSMKELGFNTIRKHLKIEPLRWYYHCDRIGMVVWQDMVNGGGKIFLPFCCYLPNLIPAVTGCVRDNLYWLLGRGNRQGRQEWEKECMAVTELLYNTPSIGMWVLFNEGWGQFDALRLEKKVREADPTRLIDHASGWFDQGGGDICSIHTYFRRLKLKNDRRPCVISEYGGYSCVVPGHAYADASYGYHSCRTVGELAEAAGRLFGEIRKLKEQGLSGAVFTQLSDVEGEMNGIYTYDRRVCKLPRGAAAMDASSEQGLPEQDGGGVYRKIKI